MEIYIIIIHIYDRDSRGGLGKALVVINSLPRIKYCLYLAVLFCCQSWWHNKVFCFKFWLTCLKAWDVIYECSPSEAQALVILVYNFSLALMKKDEQGETSNQGLGYDVTGGNDCPPSQIEQAPVKQKFIHQKCNNIFREAKQNKGHQSCELSEEDPGSNAAWVMPEYSLISSYENPEVKLNPTQPPRAERGMLEVCSHRDWHGFESLPC